MKKIVVLIIILLGIVLALVLGQSYFKNNNSFFAKNSTLTIEDKIFRLDVARTDEERETGLVNKERLQDDEGMLFVFDEPGYYSFWMKNMKFPIDILFIRNDIVVTIYEDVQPPTSSEQSIPVYQPISPADFVFEIKAGLSSKYNFKEGSRIKIENL